MDCSTAFPPPKSSWRAYVEWMQLYEQLILRTVNLVSWWSNHDQHMPSQWREAVWTLINLHRLGVDVGMHYDEKHYQIDSTERNDTGMTIILHKRSKPLNWEEWIRICLSAIQCIWPLVDQPENYRKYSRQLVVLLERIRFLLRAAIVVNHWRILSRDYPDILPGILRHGGEVTFGNDVASSSRRETRRGTEVPTADAERSRMSRQQYKGTRTGRRVIQRARGASTETESVQGSNLLVDKLKIFIGEALYLARPLFQAEADLIISNASLPFKSPHGNSLEGQKWKVWITSLLMDVVSLGSLRSLRSIASPSFTRECKRRQMRLFLYLLRSPLWEGYSYRCLDATSSVIEYIPLLGRIVSSYLWDWIYYYKLYRTEAG